MKIMFTNWRDQFGSDLERAQQALDLDLNNNQLATRAHLSPITIKGLRSGQRSLEGASWSTVNRLAQVSDMMRIENEIGKDYETFMIFQNRLNLFFVEAIQEERDIAKNSESFGDEKQMEKVLLTLQRNLLSDIALQVELYKAYKDE